MMNVSDDNELPEIDPNEERRIVRKLDFCLIPLMAMFQLLLFLDRVNRNARVAGLQVDLGLTDHQYQICVTVLYAPYVAAELPSTLLLRKVGPNVMMPTIITICGVICALQGVYIYMLILLYWSGSLFFCVSAIYSLPPILAAWMAYNSEPHYRRATSVAMAFISSKSGGILSTWRYPTESPRFTKVTIMNLTFSALILVVSVLNVLYLSWATRRKHERRDELLAPYIKDAPKAPQDGGDQAWAELGDKHPDFKYVI